MEFTGDDQQLSGLTVAALDQMAGVPEAFRWRLEQEDDHTWLYYQQAQEDEWLVARWYGTESRFEYLNAEQEWLDRWQPDKQLGVQNALLPKAVRLILQNSRDSLHWHVNLSGRKILRQDYRLIE